MPFRVVLFGALLLLVAAPLVGCADDVALPPDADAEIVLGHEIYRARCASCHGPSGGGGIGPSVRGIEGKLEDAAQLEVVVEGRKNMPRFADVLSDEEIAAVVRYTREIL